MIEITMIHTKIAGVSFEGRQRTVDLLEEGEILKLERDPANKYDYHIYRLANALAEKFIEPALVKPAHAKGGPMYNMPLKKGVEKNIEARINGVILSQGSIDKGWLVFKIEPEQLEYGRNLISVRVKNRVADASDKKIIIEKPTTFYEEEENT